MQNFNFYFFVEKLNECRLKPAKLLHCAIRFLYIEMLLKSLMYLIFLFCNCFCSCLYSQYIHMYMNTDNVMRLFSHIAHSCIPFTDTSSHNAKS